MAYIVVIHEVIRARALSGFFFVVIVVGSEF